MSEANHAICPSCGRALPPDHALCVKCGWRRDTGLDTPAERARTFRQVWLVVALGVGLFGALIVATLLLWPTDDPPTRSRRTGERPPVAEREEPRRPLAPPPRARRPARPRPTPPVAPTPVPPRLGPAPGPPTPRRSPRVSSLIDRVRACVDRRRRKAERDCESTRRWLGFTAESICLIAKVGAGYWSCLKGEANNLGACVLKCGGVARRCASRCTGLDRHGHSGGTAGCLWQCWRRDIDPCLGRCIRP